MTKRAESFYKLLDAYFNALVRGGTQTKIDEARLAIIAEHDRLQNEVDDLRGFIDGTRAHVKAVAKMYGYSALETVALCECPPDCQGPDNTSAQCRAENRGVNHDV